MVFCLEGVLFGLGVFQKKPSIKGYKFCFFVILNHFLWFWISFVVFVCSLSVVLLGFGSFSLEMFRCVFMAIQLKSLGAPWG